jgi:arylsulfatase A-like enzyme
VIRAAAAPEYPAIHLFGLWSLVAAQPVYDVLRQNGEFFVAHRASPLDLLLFTAAITLASPALLALLVRGVRCLSTTAGRVLHLLLVGTLVCAFASQVLARVSSPGVAAHVALAVATGTLAVWVYARTAPVRLVLAVLGVLVPVSAGAFLLDPAMRPLVRPNDRSRNAAVPVPRGAPPIVIVVFDQLPVTSLMGPDGTIDAGRYPGFAALARTATWFRNATANAELTAWAVPSLLSGNLPRRARLPITAHHPQNVFTVLGGSYRMQVTEPITQLCPERLCPAEADSRARRLAAMVLDAGLVYLHVVAPRDLRGRLPSLANDWKDFLAAQHWHQRWIRQRHVDRRQPATHFIDSIRRSDAQPTLYYLHALLPHEPFIYSRSGQQFTSDTVLPGLTRLDRWISEEWPPIQGYQKHLLQVEYVDALVERLLRQLTNEELFDRSLIVVTADHGASFRAGHPFRGLDGLTVPDIVPVPLFIKEPHQRSGRIDDRNVQAIDLLATLASMLHVRLRSPVDGRAVIDGARLPARKVIRHMGAARQVQIAADTLAQGRMKAVARRWALFEGTASPVPAGAPRGLLGLPPPADTVTTTGGTLQVLLRDPQLLRNVDISAPLLPLALQGRVLDREGRPGSSVLAIAVNGTIRAVTRTLDRLEPGTWSAQLEPGVLRDGPNDVQVFLVGPDGSQLQLAYPAGLRPPALDLASDTAAKFWSVRQAGLSTPQPSRVPFRWTERDASITAPIEPARPPRSLRIGLAGPPPSRARVRLDVNDCALYEGPVESTPWYRTFSLDRCPGLRAASEARIRIRALGGFNNGPQGVSLEIVNLFPTPWPPAGADDRRAAVHVVGNVSERVAHVDLLALNVQNRGATAWVDAAGNQDGGGDAALEFRWRPLPAGPEDRTQRLRLPRVLHPGDEVLVEVPLVPPPSVDGADSWDLAIVPVTAGGTEIPLEAPCTVRVRSAPGGS